MKRIFLILAVASLLFACDKTENEQDILNTFIGYASISMNVQTLDATGVQSSYATLRGSVALKETDKTIDANGFYISASPDPLETGTIMECPTTVFVNGKAEFTKQVGNLQPNTPYYYVAFAQYHDQTEYGTEKIFTTITPPEIAVADGLVVYYTFDNEDGRERQGKMRYDGVATGIPEFTSDIPGSSGKAIELAGNTYDQYYEISPTPFKEAMENSEHDPNVEIAVNFWLKTDNRQQTIYTHHASYSTNEVIPRLEIRSNSGGGCFHALHGFPVSLPDPVRSHPHFRLAMAHADVSLHVPVRC
jgi:hypothetical protein